MADDDDNNSASRKDPVTTFLFGLKIDDLSLDYTQGTAFFKSVSGLGASTQADDYNEGGVTAFTRKVIGVTKWNPLVLKQGFTGDMNLFQWRANPFRTNGTIYVLGAGADGLEVVCSWDFVNGFCSKWEGPEYDASKNEIAIESIEICHEGLTMKLGNS